MAVLLQPRTEGEEVRPEHLQAPSLEAVSPRALLGVPSEPQLGWTYFSPLPPYKWESHLLVAITEFSERSRFCCVDVGMTKGARHISVLRNSQLSSPANLPGNGLEGTGDVPRCACWARRGQGPACIFVTKGCDDACPWSHIRGFWGQLQMDLWIRLGPLCPRSVWESLGDRKCENRVWPKAPGDGTRSPEEGAEEPWRTQGMVGLTHAWVAGLGLGELPVQVYVRSEWDP